MPNPTGPLSRSKRMGTKPKSNNDVKLGTYYYGTDCPVCKETSPVIRNINQHLKGAYIDTIATDREWQFDEMRNDKIETKKMSDGLRASLKHGGITATPTMYWEDGLKQTGLPSTGRDIAYDELDEFYCLRAAKVFLKLTRPEMHDDEIHETVTQLFDSPHVEEMAPDGSVDGRNPYAGVQMVTRHY